MGKTTTAKAPPHPQAFDATPDPTVVKPPRPRDAATLLIVRRDSAEPKVLMGRRSGGHAFMPNKWVFPGGRIHASDFRVPVARELTAQTAAALERTTSASRARAIALAAIRETYEETGLRLAQPAPPLRSRGEWGAFLASGARPDLGALEFVARAITPPARSRRFDARFFVADASALLSLDAGSGSGELNELAWFNWDAAGGLDLPSITRAILHEVALRLEQPGRPVPFHRFVRGEHRLGAV